MRHELIAAAERMANDALAPHAAAVDADNRFPREGIGALTDAGFIGFFVPTAVGGLGGSYSEYAQVAQRLGAGCLSTALIWAMHCQQVAVIAEHALEANRDVLDEVAQSGALVASITTEPGKGGDLMTAHAALVKEDGRLRVRREAPVVSYGGEARFYVATMRSGPDRPPHDVSLVLLSRNDGDVRVVGDWNALGMRGTRSVPMRLDATVSFERVIGTDFRSVVSRTMIPAGHIGWASAWHGAASDALTRVIRWLRGSSATARLDSDLVRSRLASLRVSLDLVAALRDRLAAAFDELRRQQAPSVAYEEPTLLIELNGLKIAAAEVSFAVVNSLVELVGMREGYLRGGELRLELTLRDLRSASLMFADERLRQINGRLLVIEGADARPAIR